VATPVHNVLELQWWSQSVTACPKTVGDHLTTLLNFWCSETLAKSMVTV